MAEDREVVGLLHRADWTKLTLSGTVRGAEPVVDTVITVQSDEPPGGPWEREDEDAEPPLPPRFMFELDLVLGSPALKGDVRLGSRYRGAQLAEKDAGTVRGVTDRGGRDRQGGHRIAEPVPHADADGADA